MFHFNLAVPHSITPFFFSLCQFSISNWYVDFSFFLFLLLLRFKILWLDWFRNTFFLNLLLSVSSWNIINLLHLDLLAGSLCFLNYLLNFGILFFFLYNWSLCKYRLKYLFLFDYFRLYLFRCLIKNVIHYFWFLLFFFFTFLLFKRILNSYMF